MILELFSSLNDSMISFQWIQVKVHVSVPGWSDTLKRSGKAKLMPSSRGEGMECLAAVQLRCLPSN